MGRRPSFGTGWKRATWPMSWASPRTLGSGRGRRPRRCRQYGGAGSRPRATPTAPSGRCRSTRPLSKAKGWKTVRWRQGTKGWLESRFLALRVQPSHGFVEGEPPHKEVWLLAEWPETEKEPTKYLLCDSAGDLYPAPLGAPRQVPLEDRTGLPATEGRTGAGSLRRTRLGRLASPCHAGHAGPRVSHARDPAAKKKLLGGPCRRRAVRFSTCSLPGPESAPTAGQQILHDRSP